MSYVVGEFMTRAVIKVYRVLIKGARKILVDEADETQNNLYLSYSTSQPKRADYRTESHVLILVH